MGITEPAIFGVNMRYFKPFICGCIGGACGALFASITLKRRMQMSHPECFLLDVLLCLNMPVQYILMMVISIGVSFALTWIFGSTSPVSGSMPTPSPKTPDANVSSGMF